MDFLGLGEKKKKDWLSDWGVQSWLSHQKISSQTGGHLSPYSLHFEVSLHGQGTWWNGERNVIKLPIRSEPAALRILIVLRVCQQCQWTPRTVWSAVREPLWTSARWAVWGRRLWWPALSESINFTNINNTTISGREIFYDNPNFRVKFLVSLY